MKSRLDQLLVERGLVDSRTQAHSLIMAGAVTVGDQVVTKAGTSVPADAIISVRNAPKYVSRAGDKLASVAERFQLNFTNKVVLDVGSSTGGFTDYALQNGAARVYAVDVGSNQLAYKLRTHERVVVMERTDIRAAELPEQADMAVIDVSFISLTKVLEAVAALVKPSGLIVAMAKPQFEAGKAIADQFNGVIYDPQVRADILDQLASWIKERFEVIDEADSGVAGMHGNLEHFFLLKATVKGSFPKHN